MSKPFTFPNGVSGINITNEMDVPITARDLSVVYGQSHMFGTFGIASDKSIYLTTNNMLGYVAQVTMWVTYAT